jgi:hypothetical protein
VYFLVVRSPSCVIISFSIAGALTTPDSDISKAFRLFSSSSPMPTSTIDVVFAILYLPVTKECATAVFSVGPTEKLFSAYSTVTSIFTSSPCVTVTVPVAPPDRS